MDFYWWYKSKCIIGFAQEMHHKQHLLLLSWASHIMNPYTFCSNALKYIVWAAEQCTPGGERNVLEWTRTQTPFPFVQ